MKGVISHKGRRYWTLRTSELYANKEARLDWATLLPPDTGTRRQRSSLTTACKEVLEAIMTRPRSVNARAISSHLTVIHRFGHVRRLAQWMAARGIWRFSQLAPDDVTNYLQGIEARRGSEGAIAAQTLGHHVHLLQCLWDLRHGLPDALTFDVGPMELDILATIRTRRRIPWRHIDEANALRLLRTAKHWMDTHAPYVGSLLERLWAQHREVVALTRSRAKKHRTAFYAGLAEEPEFQQLAQDLRMAKRTPYIVLRAGVGALEGAALLTILLLVGLRSQEAARLDVDCVRGEELEDPDGLVLAGIAAKKGGESRTWAITDPVNDAVKAMRSMLSAPRAVSGQASLLLGGAAASCAVFPGRVPERANPKTVTYRMRAFVRAAFPGDSPLERRVHPHAARKTFARFVVMRDRRVLESLAYHYGHTHRAITDGYYVGADMELAQLLDAENRQDLARSLVELLTSRNVAGKAGRAFEATRKEVASLRGKATLQSVVDRLISDGVQLAPCDWGYCVYSKALSACHGDAKGPNEAFRTAEICSGCSNFLVTERHRAWWEERVVRDEQFLEAKALPEQTIKVVRRRLSRSVELLSDLNANRVAPAATGRRGKQG